MSAIITRIDKSKHKQIMLRILHDIYSNNYLKDKLIFKWWTAFYLFYSLDRFSTDLDFDLLEWADEKKIIQEIKKISTKYSEIKDLYNKRYTIFFLLSYWWLDHNIKIEINKRWISWDYEIKNLIWINILVLKIWSLTANKLIALTNRSSLANRDLYDIDFIFKNNLEIDENIIELRTWLTLKQYFQKCLIFLNDIPLKYSILDWLGTVLDEKQKFYVKNKLFAYLKKEFEIRSL